MKNIAPRKIQYKLDFFIPIHVIDGEGLAKKIARIKYGREAIDMLKSVVGNAPDG